MNGLSFFLCIIFIDFIVFVVVTIVSVVLLRINGKNLFPDVVCFCTYV
jgi:hypothetical protein